MTSTQLIPVPAEAKQALDELTTVFRAEYKAAMAVVAQTDPDGATAFRRLADGAVSAEDITLAYYFADRLSIQLKHDDINYHADEYDFDDASGAAFRVATQLEMALCSKA